MDFQNEFVIIAVIVVLTVLLWLRRKIRRLVSIGFGILGLIKTLYWLNTVL